MIKNYGISAFQKQAHTIYTYMQFSVSRIDIELKGYSGFVSAGGELTVKRVKSRARWIKPFKKDT